MYSVECVNTNILHGKPCSVIISKGDMMTASISTSPNIGN